MFYVLKFSLKNTYQNADNKDIILAWNVDNLMPAINYYRLHVVKVSINQRHVSLSQWLSWKYYISPWQIDECRWKKNIFNHFSYKSPSRQSGRHRVLSPLHEGLVGPISLQDEGTLMWWRHNPPLKYFTGPPVYMC